MDLRRAMSALSFTFTKMAANSWSSSQLFTERPWLWRKFLRIKFVRLPTTKFITLALWIQRHIDGKILDHYCFGGANFSCFEITSSPLKFRMGISSREQTFCFVVSFVGKR